MKQKGQNSGRSNQTYNKRWLSYRDVFVVILAKCQIVSNNQQQHQSTGRTEGHYHFERKQIMNEKQFIENVANIIGDKPQKAKLLKSVFIAQACLESGLGQSELYIKAYNMFGLNNYHDEVSKIYGTYKLKVPQEVNGKWIYKYEDMAKHKNLTECVEHLVRWYTMRDKYKTLIGCTNYKTFCNFLTGKYATDSHYGEKLISIIERYNLTSYDDVKPESKTLHTIQLGQYSIDSNALNYMKKVIASGIPASATKIKSSFYVYITTYDINTTTNLLKAKKIDFIINESIGKEITK